MNKKIEQQLYLILYFLMACIVVFNVFDVNILVSAAFYGTFVVVPALWCYKIKTQKIEWSDKMAVLIILAAFLSVMINALLTKSTLSFAYVKKLIFFSFTIIFLRIACDGKLSVKTTKTVFHINTFVVIFLCVMFILQRQEMYVINEIVTKYLTFRFNNPNEVAMLEVCICFMEAIATLTEKRTKPRLFHGILCVIMAYFILESQSRNAQIAVAIFACLFLWIWFPKRKQPAFDKKIYIFLLMLPLLFALMYILVIDNPVVNSLFSFMVSEGKKLSSRMKIWGPAVEHFLSSPIIGAYSQISDGTGVSQMHNTHVDVLASYGTVTYMLLVIYLIKIVGKVREGCKSSAQNLCIAGFMGAYMLGMGEAAMFSGGLGIYILIIQFLLLAKSPVFEEKELICESYLYRIISTTIRKRFPKK